MRRLLPLLLLPLLVTGLTIAPATAATIYSFTVDDGPSASVHTGDTVELAWSVAVAGDTIEASSTGPSDAGFDGPYDANDSETLELDEPGVYTFTITAVDDNSAETGSVTVTVEEPTEVTPDPITFPSECTVVIPASTGDNTGVEYGYGAGMQGGGLDAGTYEFADLGGRGSVLTFVALPAEGYAFPEGTDPLVTVTPPDACFADDDDDADDDADIPTTAPAAGISDRTP